MSANDDSPPPTPADPAAARRQADFLQTVIRTAAEGICVCAPCAEEPFVHFTVWNDRMTELTGYTMAEINRLGWYQSMYPDPVVQRRAIERMERMRTGDDIRQEEWAITRKDGTERVLAMSTSHVDTADGPAVVALMTDVTDRRALEERLREARRLESIGVLAGGIAHEFNNLLTTILGHADLAEAEVPRSSAARAHLEPIRQAGRRAAELCRQMLAYAGKGRLVVGPVDLSAVARDAAAGLGPDVPLDVDLPADLPPVRGDAEQLRQMVGNLLTNAAEAVAGTAGRVRLTTYWDRLDAKGVGRLRHTPGLPPEEYVAVAVRDDGPGMDRATLARVFEPFFSTKFPGRGLGLPVVLGVVRGHGGGLDVESEPGKGTTVRVYLPVNDG